MNNKSLGIVFNFDIRFDFFKDKKKLNKNLVNKEERRKRFKSMSSSDRQELILKKMKAKGIEVGSGIPNKKYDSAEVFELIRIANCFPELREKK
jgi:hypothetical protein